MIKQGQEDIILIQETLDGNTQAQEILYKKYTKSVTNFLREKYTSYNDFDDDVAEIMIKVFIKLESFDNIKSKFRSWVYSIAKNHMIDKWRSNTITVTGNSTVLSVDDDVNIGNYITSTSTNSINFNQATFTTNCCAGLEFENCSSINHISNQITPQDFTLLDMKYVQGYDYNEIGMEFNVTSSTISNRVNYIKSKLKKNNPEIIHE